MKAQNALAPRGATIGTPHGPKVACALVWLLAGLLSLAIGTSVYHGDCLSGFEAFGGNDEKI